MGRCESAKAAIAARFSIKDLIEAIYAAKDETKEELIDILNSVYIEDENNFYYDYFLEIIDEEENFDELVRRMKETGGDSYVKKLPIGEVSGDSSLYAQSALYQIANLVGCDRWGYNRYGENCNSTALDLDFISSEKERSIKFFAKFGIQVEVVIMATVSAC